MQCAHYMQMEIARLESRSEAASMAAREVEIRAQTSAAATVNAVQAQRDTQAQVSH